MTVISIEKVIGVNTYTSPIKNKSPPLFVVPAKVLILLFFILIKFKKVLLIA
jgi:hypothetical protein